MNVMQQEKWAQVRKYASNVMTLIQFYNDM